jgi:uncharacterized protein (TIGR03083 family)
MLKMVETVHLFLPLHGELISLLRSLSNEDWERPTVAARWRVKDVAAHLLDGDLRRLSIHRDGYAPTARDGGAPSYEELLGYLNALNASWVEAAARLSPPVIVELLAWAGPQVATFFATLPPDGPACFPVAWAGEGRSVNWMDVGRDYTEKWHHQAQIRDAVGAPDLNGGVWLSPVLELSLRALPYTFRNFTAADASAFNVVIEGEAGGSWHIFRNRGEWELREGEASAPLAAAQLDADSAWRLFFNALNPEEAQRRIRLTGDKAMGTQFLRMRSVMV